jgi:hypothetical protein
MKIKIILLLSAFFLTFSLHSLAQKDSVKTEYSQEKLSESGKFESTLCELITKREKRDRDLWKYNLLGTLAGGLNFSYEHRLANQWTLNMHSVTDAPLVRGLSIFSSQNQSRAFSESLSVDLRFWFDQNRRIRKGKRTDFTGAYVALSLITELHYTHVVPFDTNPPYTYSAVSPFLTLQLGYQWRIGRLGYIDTHLGGGLGYSFNYLNGKPDFRDQFKIYQTIDLHLGIGIAF